MLTSLVNVIMVALATAAVSMTVTKAQIFKPVRAFIQNKNVWLGELFSCPYCFSHWVTVLVCGIGYEKVMLTNVGVPFVDWLISVFAIITLSTAFAGWLILKPFADE